MTEIQQEQACLYVLGMLSGEEARAFEVEIESNQEISDFVASANNATLAIARSAPMQEPPAELKKRLLASVAAHAESKVAPFHAPSRSRWSPVPWAIAACLLGMLYVQFDQHHKQQTTFEAEIQRSKAQQQIASEALTNTQKTLNERDEKLVIAEAARADLFARVTALEQKNSLAEAQVVVLASQLKDRPQAVAVSLWDQQKQTGQLVVENLPVLSLGKDYQLWVIDPGNAAPVSAGVFKVDGTGKVRISFKPDQPILTAEKFAVTEETEGGVASPTMEKMVVIGGS